MNHLLTVLGTPTVLQATTTNKDQAGSQTSTKQVDQRTRESFACAVALSMLRPASSRALFSTFNSRNQMRLSSVLLLPLSGPSGAGHTSEDASSVQIRRSSGASSLPGRAFSPRRLYTSNASDSVADANESATVDVNTALSDSGNEFATNYHAPVMWRECVEALLQTGPPTGKSSRRRDRKRREQGESEATDDDRGIGQNPRQCRVFVDGTLGGGGHSLALLKHLGPGDVVYGCDVDPQARRVASERLQHYMDARNWHALPRFVAVESNFAHLHSHAEFHGQVGCVDGILLDLGVSSHQIDTVDRGFTFSRLDGPLDMRMNPGLSLRACDLCNELDAKELASILRTYGDESRARAIAESIVNHRPLMTTGHLHDAVAAVTPAFHKESRRKGLTATLARVFQALRIVVNQEDAMLERALTEMAPTLLRPGGRLVVLSYHSLEDRATKRVMRDGSIRASPALRERDAYGNPIIPLPFQPIGKAFKASPEEVSVNSRARSAVLRVAERL